ncbi:hypothetical protein PSTT_11594, partial [Puccinia striiformis]
MRIAYAAEVKTLMTDGIEWSNNWVTKGILTLQFTSMQLHLNRFIKEHVCHPGNKACEALQLGKAVHLKWVKPGGLAQIVGSHSCTLPYPSGFYSAAS